MSMTSRETQLAEAAQELRNLAKLTAKHSQNWDNFEAIALSMLSDAYDAGVSQSSVEPSSEDKDALKHIPVIWETGKEIHDRHMEELKENELQRARTEIDADGIPFHAT